MCYYRFDQFPASISMLNHISSKFKCKSVHLGTETQTNNKTNFWKPPCMYNIIKYIKHLNVYL